MFLGIELCHRNFRKLPEYQTNSNSTSRTISHQVLLFSVTMLFLSSPGLRALYDAINRNLPNLCPYAIRQCGKQHQLSYRMLIHSFLFINVVWYIISLNVLFSLFY